MNEVRLEGKIVSAVTRRQTKSGLDEVSCTLNCPRFVRSGSSAFDLIDVKAFGDNAEALKHYKTGDRIAVWGGLRSGFVQATGIYPAMLEIE